MPFVKRLFPCTIPTDFVFPDLSKQLAGYSLIEKDIRNVQLWVNEAKKRLLESSGGCDILVSTKSTNRADFQFIKALFVASITFYGKLFTEAKGRRVKLDSSIYSTESHKSLHKDLMDYRHQFTAHSGENSPEKVKIVLVTPPKQFKKELPHVVTELSQPDTVSVKELDQILILLSVLHKYAREKISKINDRIYDAEVYSRLKNASIV